MRKSISGFTIVELLIVIVVIAILAAISVVEYSGIQNRAKNSQIQAAAASYAKSLQLYATDNGLLPTPGQSGGSYSCLGNYDDGTCGNFTGNAAHAQFDTLLSKYRGGTNRPNLPEEYMYTNNYNNWWRGIWYYADQGSLRFVQYKTSSCPGIAGTTFVSLSYGYNGHIICTVMIDT